MAPLPSAVRVAFEAALESAYTTTDLDEMWHALERAHILSQRWAWPHTRAHWHMLRLALRCHDRGEAFGQLVRLSVAGLGSSVGRVPIGNTGRAAVGISTPMPVPAELARILDQGDAELSVS
ncbi:DUF3703 domain-containing protein [Nocardia sp. NPDC051463]|uniref:DUF3703 domain-containing protein n=1 Tax=Nocardia sp. NPDC051463 TaxID=3154845 RepID=UPI00344DFED2